MWQLRFTASLRRTRTELCLVTAARGRQQLDSAQVTRLLLWCGHALHLQRSTHEHFDRTCISQRILETLSIPGLAPSARPHAGHVSAIVVRRMCVVPRC